MKATELIAVAGLWLCAACSTDGDALPSSSRQGEWVEVQLMAPGTYGTPLGEAAPRAQADGAAVTAPDGMTLKDEHPHDLADGTTLWLIAEPVGEAGSLPADTAVVRSYVVRTRGDGRQALYPCECDADGKVIRETNLPLLLQRGVTYRFRAVAPAYAFAEGAADAAGNPVNYALAIDNKDYLVAHDNRYEQTQPKEVAIGSQGEPVQVVELNPMISQTAQLEFTIYYDAADPDIHQLHVLQQGVEISGVQNYYAKSAGGVPWNWSLGDTLRTVVGDNNTRVTVRMGEDRGIPLITESGEGMLSVKCPILPTDAWSTSLIVLFNLSVNGIPTQYEMMLNRKIFRAAFNYHYVGRVYINEGVSAITWQYVDWDQEVPILPPANP